jgi:polyisoprenoid-binding protein YceI
MSTSALALEERIDTLPSQSPIPQFKEPRMQKLVAFALASSLAFVAVPAFAANYTIDSKHSSATFAVKHFGVSTVRGEFGSLTGTLTMDAGDVKTAKVSASVDVSSVSTREPKRDEHLKTADFFDVAKFPTMTFKSTAVAVGAAGAFKLTGDLTIKGVTKSVTFDCQPLSKETATPFGTTIVGTEGTTKINRKDFNVTAGKASAIVGDDVTITIDLELTKAK